MNLTVKDEALICHQGMTVCIVVGVSDEWCFTTHSRYQLEFINHIRLHLQRAPAIQ